MSEMLARNEELKRENATLRTENERLRNQLCVWDPNFLLKSDLPSAEEGLQLWLKITSKFPRMISPSDSKTDQVRGMIAAMAFVFTCRKTSESTTRFDGSWWNARAVALASEAQLGAPRIRSVLLGIVATNDVPYVLSNNDLYLDAYGRGAPISRDAWRKLLSGAPVREPQVVREKQLDHSIGFRQQIPSW
jgi:hypothetical protein